MYLVVTFTSTGLAKLRRRKLAEVGIIREGTIPAKLASTAVVCLSVIELALAVLVISAVDTFAIGISTAILFLSFGIYRMTSAIRTGLLSCSCAGGARISKATIMGTLGVLASSLIQGAIALLWAFRPSQGGWYIQAFLATIGICLLFACLRGATLQRREFREGLAS
nr:MauE/DoxX family redox-associated membrane protein [Frankia gtarii]